MSTKIHLKRRILVDKNVHKNSPKMSTRIHPKNVPENSPKKRNSRGHKCPREFVKSVLENSPIRSTKIRLLCLREFFHSPHYYSPLWIFRPSVDSDYVEVSGLALTCQLPYFYSLFCNLSWWFECLVVNNRLVNNPPASSQCIPAILYLFLFVCISLFKESIAFFYRSDFL